MSTFNDFWRLTAGTTGGPDTADNFGGNPPKLKFNFAIEFIPRTIQLPYLGNYTMSGNAFACKNFARPKTTINYQNVNFYNFRSEIAINTKFEPVSATFYDDVDNKSHGIIDSYLKSVSPIFGATQSEADGFDRNGQSSSASLGALAGNRHGVIQAILVAHYFWNRGEIKTTFYTFLNPKIMSMEYDELDMTESNVSTISFTFTYDSYSTFTQ